MSLVSNGCVDFRGRIADKRKTGGWKAAPFIIVNEVAERLAFYSVAAGLGSYLSMEMHEPLMEASTIVSDWIGAAFLLTILGAFLTDAYLGRFTTLVLFSFIYFVGMVMLTLNAALNNLRPPPCTEKPCTPATSGQAAFLYSALGLIALGTGGIKPCVSSFGADQYDEDDEHEATKKYSFFDWFFFAINMGVLFGVTFMVYLQERKGWAWGFGVPAGVLFGSIIVLVAGFWCYRYKTPKGSPFTRFVQVTVVSFKNHFKGVGDFSDDQLYEVDTRESDILGTMKLSHTSDYRFLDKAAYIEDHEMITRNRWKLCTVTQVEEFKCFLRVLPIWATTIVLSISFAQMSTFFISQAKLMDRNLGPNFFMPAGSAMVFFALNALILVPLYEKLIVPVLRSFTGHKRGLTSLQRMGVGLFISIPALISAAVVEHTRRNHPHPESLSVFYLFPQYFLVGSAEVFTYVGQLEFFYDEATDGTRSISSAVFLSELGIGHWLSTAIVKMVEKTTGTGEEGWLRDDLNEGRLDYYYWLLVAINGANWLVYMLVARTYKGRDGPARVNAASLARTDSTPRVDDNVDQT